MLPTRRRSSAIWSKVRPTPAASLELLRCGRMTRASHWPGELGRPAQSSLSACARSVSFSHAPDSQALLGDLVEGTAIALQRGLAARQPLPAQNHRVHIRLVKLDAPADALGDFRGGQRGAAAQEWVVDGLAALRVIQQRGESV